MDEKHADFVSNESQLVRNVIWDKKEISLSQFVSQYKLPQLVCVETGYYGTDERSVLSSGQLLTLHKIYETAKVICEPSNRSAVLISLACPDQAEVLPLPKYCEYSHLTAATLEKLPDACKAVKYLRVLEVDPINEADCCVGEMLRLVKVNVKESRIECSNMARENHNSFHITFNSSTLFMPLIDTGRYTIAEIKAKFGLPAKVRFLGSSTKQRETQENLASFGDVLILGEYSDSIILATTLCEELCDKICIAIPRDLEVTVVVPRALLSADQDSGNYQRIIKTLHQGFEAVKLDEFPDLDTEQHMNAVQKAMSMFSINEKQTVEYLPSNARHILPDLRYNAYFDHTDTAPPPLLPRGSKHVATTSTKMPPPADQRQPPPLSPKPKFPSTITPVSPKSAAVESSKISKSPPPPTSPRPKTHLKSKPLSTTLPNRGLKATAVSSSPSQAKKSYTFNFSMFTGMNAKKKKALSLPEATSKEKFHDVGERSLEKEGLIDDDDDNDYIKMDDYQDIDDDDHDYIEVEESKDDHLCESFMNKHTEPLLKADLDESDGIYEAIYDDKESDLPMPKMPAVKDDLLEKRKIDLSQIPQDISMLNVQQVGDILISLNLHKFVELFQHEMIDGALLKTMDESSLRDLDIDKFHAHKLMLFISGWRPNV